MNISGTQHVQPKHRHRRGCGPVGVKVAYNENALLLLNSVQQQLGGSLDAFKRVIRFQLLQPGIQLAGMTHTPCSVNTGQQRWHVMQLRQL